MIIYVVANGEKMILHTFFIFRILSYKIKSFSKIRVQIKFIVIPTELIFSSELINLIVDRMKTFENVFYVYF